MPRSAARTSVNRVKPRRNDGCDQAEAFQGADERPCAPLVRVMFS